MNSTSSRIAVAAAWLLAVALAANAQTVRVLRFADSKPFQMGKVTSRRIVYPDMGAKRTTLNYSASEDGAEFSQHTHDQSDDAIVVLQGRMDLRQGDSRTPYQAGQCAFVPGGQIHGTITTAPDTIMISFQTPPDFALLPPHLPVLSSMRTDSPSSIAPSAVENPAAPVPTTTTSYVLSKLATTTPCE